MKNNVFIVFSSGTLIGLLGGLMGLGGAEFRLPLLITLFGFASLAAVILNKAMSLILVASALPFRAATIPFAVLVAHGDIIVNLLAGSLLGAWFGAGWAIRLTSAALYKTIALLLLFIAGVAAGFGIGVVAALLGVAGGELLIPTLILLFGVDIKLAGSLSLAISLPTMLTSFARYSRDQSFVVITENRQFLSLMALGSLCGTFLGGQLLGVVPTKVLLPLLALILVISAVKVWRHG